MSIGTLNFTLKQSTCRWHTLRHKQVAKCLYVVRVVSVLIHLTKELVAIFRVTVDRLLSGGVGEEKRHIEIWQ